MAAAVVLLRPAPAQIQSGTLLDKPRPIVDFTMTGDDGKPFTRARLLGRWHLIYVGYTYCPDVCPTTLATLKEMHRLLGADAAKVQVVFLSVDPERDTPQRLAQYVHYFSPDFQAITGDKAQLDALGTNLNFVYMKVPGATPQSYSMDHSAALILVNPQAEVAGFVTPPIVAEALAADLRNLMAAR
ncbi:MAG: SCO family protein [Nevskia sp.]|nr:SCO family protein [Nevskia sp.]